MTEAERIAGLQSGNPAAYRDTITAFGKRVFGTALGVVGSREDAEDVAQEVFAEVFRSVARFRGDASLSTWIYRITLSKAREHLRRQHRQKRAGNTVHIFSARDDDPNTYRTLTNIPTNDPDAQASHRLEAAEQRAALFDAIALLPERQQTAFLLAKLEERTYTEIAEEMGVSLASVESLLFRAKQGLRKHLESYYDANF